MSDLIDREALLKRLHDAGGCGAPRWRKGSVRNEDFIKIRSI